MFSMFSKKKGGGNGGSFIDFFEMSLEYLNAASKWDECCMRLTVWIDCLLVADKYNVIWKKNGYGEYGKRMDRRERSKGTN